MENCSNLFTATCAGTPHKEHLKTIKEELTRNKQPDICHLSQKIICLISDLFVMIFWKYVDYAYPAKLGKENRQVSTGLFCLRTFKLEGEKK